MAGPNVESLNYVIDFIKDVLFKNFVYNIEDLYDIRVECGTIIKDGDQIYLLDKITELLNDHCNINEVNYILSMTLYYNNNVPKLWFSMNNDIITYN